MLKKIAFILEKKLFLDISERTLQFKLCQKEKKRNSKRKIKLKANFTYEMCENINTPQDVQLGAWKHTERDQKN